MTRFSPTSRIPAPRAAAPVLLAALALPYLFAPGAATRAQTPEPPACESPEYRQFDFWLGDWRVTQPNGQLAGTNHIENILGGCVLMESWEGAGGSSGKSLNMYYARKGEWRQTWVDNAGGRLDLAGGLDEKGRMVMRGEVLGRDGALALHEIAWEQVAPGKVTQHWRMSRDGGKTWSDLFRGLYQLAAP